MALDVGSLLADTAFARPIKSAETCCRASELAACQLAIPRGCRATESGLMLKTNEGILRTTIVDMATFRSLAQINRQIKALLPQDLAKNSEHSSPGLLPRINSSSRDRAGRSRGAGDDSLRQRIEIANRGNRELSVENRRLRRQLACVLGRLRADTGRHPPLLGYSSKRPTRPYSEA
jgi:hypothetical protein